MNRWRPEGPKKRGRFKAKVAEMRLMAAHGVNYTQIAKIMGCHHTTVMYHLDEEFGALQRQQMTFRYRLNRQYPSEQKD